jgi:hypothetical protein
MLTSGLPFCQGQGGDGPPVSSVPPKHSTDGSIRPPGGTRSPTTAPPAAELVPAIFGGILRQRSANGVTHSFLDDRLADSAMLSGGTALGSTLVLAVGFGIIQWCWPQPQDLAGANRPGVAPLHPLASRRVPIRTFARGNESAVADGLHSTTRDTRLGRETAPCRARLLFGRILAVEKFEIKAVGRVPG